MKRFVIWIFRGGALFFQKVYEVYKNTLGFRFYKVYFYLKKKIVKLRLPWDSRVIEFFGRRGTLQIFLFVVGMIIMVPHSRLYSRDTISVPGRQTLLYHLAGPGDQDFDIEEVGVNSVAGGGQPQYTQLWRQGAVGLEKYNAPYSGVSEEEITSLGVGGTAIVKPTIMGGGLPVIPGETTQPGASSARKEIVLYKVQSGDTLSTIASKYGVQTQTILWANNLTLRSAIRPGDTLKILPVDGVVHIVKKGDTLARIAQNYNAKTQDIIAYNGMASGGVLSVGKELVIPAGQRPASAVVVTPTQTLSRTTSPISQIVAPPPSVEAPAGSGYVWPTSSKHINQYFGLRHTGVDIHGKIGYPNYAARAGKVIKSQCGWNGGYGCYIILDHGGGVTTLYGHNSKLLVSVGETVEQGQTIGLLGSTGRSTGPHLHFEVRINGRRVNPLQYIR